MVRHLDELRRICEELEIDVENVLIVGGGALALQGIRENNDLDFSIQNSPVRDKLLKHKSHDRYAALSPNIDCYFNRYQDLGVSDSKIFDEKLYVTQDGYKYVIPEIEIAYKLVVKNSNEKLRIKLEHFIATHEGWNWDLFKSLLSYYYAHRRLESPLRKRLQYARSLLLICLKNPNKLRPYVSRKFNSLLGISYRPVDAVQGQLSVKISTATLFGNHNLKEDFFRYDVLVRYLTVRAILEGDSHVLNQYERMQKLKGESQGKRHDTVTSFRRLVHSIKSQGFSNDYPLPISTKGKIIEGAHRLATALYFNIPEIPVVVSGGVGGGYYGRQWFVDRGFDKTFVELLDQTKKELCVSNGIYFPVMIWSPAGEYFSDIAAEIGERHTVVFEKELRATEDLNHLIDEIYAIDNIATWKVGLKKYLMSSCGDSFYFMLLDVPDPAYRSKPRYHSYLSKNIEKLKKDIRRKYQPKIHNYFYDIILHAGDNYEHNKKIMEVLYKETDLKKEMLL